MTILSKISRRRFSVFFGAAVFLSMGGVAIAAAPTPNAFCDPLAGTCAGNDCDTLGKTMLDGDGKNIVACLSVNYGNKTCSTVGKCKWKTMSGSGKVESFGGVYQLYLCGTDGVFYGGNAKGGCRLKNPYTDDCKCPEGYKPHWINDFNDPNYCPQVYYENRGMLMVYCMK